MVIGLVISTRFLVDFDGRGVVRMVDRQGLDSYQLYHRISHFVKPPKIVILFSLPWLWETAPLQLAHLLSLDKLSIIAPGGTNYAVTFSWNESLFRGT